MFLYANKELYIYIYIYMDLRYVFPSLTVQYVVILG